MSDQLLRKACEEAIETLEQWITLAKPDQGTLGTRMTINRIKKALGESEAVQCAHEHTSISAGGLTRECNQCGVTGLPLVNFAKVDPQDVGDIVLMDGAEYWRREDGNVVCLEGI